MEIDLINTPWQDATTASLALQHLSLALTSLTTDAHSVLYTAIFSPSHYTRIPPIRHHPSTYI